MVKLWGAPTALLHYLAYQNLVVLFMSVPTVPILKLVEDGNTFLTS